jgi:hypothetical protein
MWTSQERHGWGVVRPYLFLKQVPRSHSPCALHMPGNAASRVSRPSRGPNQCRVLTPRSSCPAHLSSTPRPYAFFSPAGVASWFCFPRSRSNQSCNVRRAQYRLRTPGPSYDETLGTSGSCEASCGFSRCCNWRIWSLSCATAVW